MSNDKKSEQVVLDMEDIKDILDGTLDIGALEDVSGGIPPNVPCPPCPHNHDS